MKTKITILLLFSVFLFHHRTLAQGAPYLERVLTISFQEERLDAALKRVASQAGFTFSYSPSVLQTDRLITFNFVNKSVREILDQFFSGTVQYKVRGKYVILTKALTSSKDTQTYSGYIVDEATGKRMRDVTVYDPVTLQSAVTNSYGFFEIKIDKPPDNLRLAINKQNYSDTVVVVPSRNGRLLNIPMKVDKEKFATFADSVQSKMKRFWHKTKLFATQRIIQANVKDTIRRKTQVSFVPFIGTNHYLSGNVINDYSFNILGGYAYGVKKFEMASIFNIERGNVEGFQLAGNFNAVGGSTHGFQLAGIFNANYGEVRGAQVAGIFNFHWAEVNGFNTAGIFNFNRKNSDAVQLAGISNLTIGNQAKPHVAGVFNMTTGSSVSQLSGVFNFTAKEFHGWQAAGVLNFTGGNSRGAQTAGILNFTGGNVRGVQTAGVLNFAGKEIQGAQIAGVLNFAKKVKGTQIGLVNISDSLGGVPIGLLSFAMKGYHKIEISADEIFYSNVAFRTGARQFHNILMLGAKPKTYSDTSTHWTFGYGIGTAPRLSKKLFLNVDLTSQQIVQGNSLESLNLLNKIYLGVDYQFARKMSLTFGATLNGYLTDRDKEGYWNLFSDYQPDVFYNENVGTSGNLKMWIGGKVGLRFL